MTICAQTSSGEVFEPWCPLKRDSFHSVLRQVGDDCQKWEQYAHVLLIRDAITATLITPRRRAIHSNSDCREPTERDHSHWGVERNSRLWRTALQGGSKDSTQRPPTRICVLAMQSHSGLKHLFRSQAPPQAVERPAPERL
jgi:hypothetical protein